MNREEMSRRLKAGEDPLDLSIEKWKDIVNHLHEIQSKEEFDDRLEEGHKNCALCQVYSANGCLNCPIRRVTGAESCLFTPWTDWVVAKEAGSLQDMRKAAVKELVFLRGLRRDGPRGNAQMS